MKLTKKNWLRIPWKLRSKRAKFLAGTMTLPVLIVIGINLKGSGLIHHAMPIDHLAKIDRCHVEPYRGAANRTAS